MGVNGHRHKFYQGTTENINETRVSTVGANGHTHTFCQGTTENRKEIRERMDIDNCRGDSWCNG